MALHISEKVPTVPSSASQIGTAVIDMRYENPHYMVEDAGSADLIAGSRLQLGKASS